jgi:hypothetical protein
MKVVPLTRDAMVLDAEPWLREDFTVSPQPCVRFVCYGVTCLWLGAVMPVLVFVNGCGEAPEPLWVITGRCVDGALTIDEDGHEPLIEMSLREVILRTAEHVKLHYTNA